MESATTSESRENAPLKWAPLVVAGLTGGIASGKTTVAGIFRELGASVLDADREGHAVLGPGEPGTAEVVAAFGAEALQPDGTVNRRWLGERVFARRADRELLNRITHPRIAERIRARLRELARKPPRVPVVVVEAALLIEAGWDAHVDRIIVVTVQPSVQVRRLMAGRGLPAAQAEARIRSQIPARERLRHADYRINGDQSLTDTHAIVADILQDLLQLAGRPRTG